MDNEVGFIDSFKDFGKEFKKAWTKFLKKLDKSVKSTLGITIYCIVLGTISAILIFNLGFVTSKTMFNTAQDIVYSISKTDSYYMDTISADVSNNSVLSANYSYRNWHGVSSNKQTMFIDGNYIYVVDGYNHSGKVVLTKYDTKFKRKSVDTFEYGNYGNKVFKKHGWDTTFLYGNFVAADDYYYLTLIGPDYGNASKSDRLNAPALRIIKLTKSMKEVCYYDVSYNQMGATRPAGWSNVAMAVSPNGKELSISTGFDGFYDSYASGEGTGSRHQIGYQLILDTKKLTLKKKSPVWATHTLGQHVIYDGNDTRVFIDACDASPVHGLLLSKVNGDNFSLSQNKQVTTPNINHYVYMNMNIGGVEISDNNYLAVYNIMDKTLTAANGGTHNSPSTEIRDIQVLVASKDNVNNAEIITLYDYTSTKPTPLTKDENTRTGGEPRILNIGKNKFLVMWYENIYNSGESFTYQTTCYMVIDGDGNVIQDVIKDDTMWMNTWSYPVYSSKNNTVYWFNDNTDKTRTFYSMKVRV